MLPMLGNCRSRQESKRKYSRIRYLIRFLNKPHCILNFFISIPLEFAVKINHFQSRTSLFSWFLHHRETCVRHVNCLSRRLSVALIGFLNPCQPMKLRVLKAIAYIPCSVRNKLKASTNIVKKAGQSNTRHWIENRTLRIENRIGGSVIDFRCIESNRCSPTDTIWWN